MIRFLPLLTASVLALSLPGFAPLPVQAQAQQNLFAPRLVINDYAVTEFEYQQRLLFLQLLRAPGDLEKVALDGLVEDRLRMMEAKKFKIALKEADLRKGMEEFASRANLSADDFIKALGQAGVEAETFRDFVAAGLVWREIARGKFTAYAKVSEEDVDRALEAETRKTALTVAVSELIIPAPPGEEARVMDLARRLSREVRGEGAFSAAVARYSAAASRGRGGRLDPMPMTNLPPQISAVVLPLAPGQVSAPVPIPGGVALFQLRSITEGRAEDAAPVEVEYARLRLPADAAGSALMAKVRAQVQTCKDLYGLAPGLPPEQLSITTQTMGAVAQDIGLELARLDPGETVLRAGGQELLMLCARRPAPPPAEAAAPAEGEAPAAPPVIDREAVRTRLINAKIERMANQYLAKLKAEAIIREP